MIRLTRASPANPRFAARPRSPVAGHEGRAAGLAARKEHRALVVLGTLACAIAPVACSPHGTDGTCIDCAARGPSPQDPGEANDDASGSHRSIADPDDAGTRGDVGPGKDPPATGAFVRRWSHAAETSALIYFQMNAIEKSAQSYVEYGETTSYGHQTAVTPRRRWAHLHRIAGLIPDTTYHFRMVLVTDGGEIASDDGTFATRHLADAIRIPDDVPGPPYELDQDNALYLLTEDISASATAITITGDGVTLELDGHTVLFSTSSTEQVRGIFVRGGGTAVVGNGHVVQGAGHGDFSSGIESRYRNQPIEVFGMTSDISGPNSYPMRLFGSSSDAHVHHNHFSSTVSEIQSRHYPGNHLLKIDVDGSNISVHDNLLTEGAHVGMSVKAGQDDTGINIECSYNDIQHHAKFVNGYALGCGSPTGANVHHNRITSTGRGTHLSSPNTEFHDNYIDIRGHMVMSDLPANSGEWHERRIELHGIKLEGGNVTNNRIYNNFVRIVQTLPDDTYDYVPATPLNIASYDPNAMNEIFDNTIVGLTEYSTTRHGSYGDAGKWAAAIYLIAMDNGPASAGRYSAWVHDNAFFTNDLYVGAGSGSFNMTVPIEDNTFTLVSDPPPTTDRSERFRGVDSIEDEVLNNNRFVEGDLPESDAGSGAGAGDDAAAGHPDGWGGNDSGPGGRDGAVGDAGGLARGDVATGDGGVFVDGDQGGEGAAPRDDIAPGNGGGVGEGVTETPEGPAGAEVGGGFSCRQGRGAVPAALLLLALWLRPHRGRRERQR